MIDPEHRLVGLQFGTREGQEEWTDYDIGVVAVHALEALQVAVLAMEQIVTGERLVKSLDIGDFYRHLNVILAEQNGEGVLSESGAMYSLQDEIQGLIDIVREAQRAALLVEILAK